ERLGVVGLLDLSLELVVPVGLLLDLGGFLGRHVAVFRLRALQDALHGGLELRHLLAGVHLGLLVRGLLLALPAQLVAGRPSRCPRRRTCRQRPDDRRRPGSAPWSSPRRMAWKSSWCHLRLDRPMRAPR